MNGIMMEEAVLPLDSTSQIELDSHESLCGERLGITSDKQEA